MQNIFFLFIFSQLFLKTHTNMWQSLGWMGQYCIIIVEVKEMIESLLSLKLFISFLKVILNLFIYFYR